MWQERKAGPSSPSETVSGLAAGTLAALCLGLATLMLAISAASLAAIPSEAMRATPSSAARPPISVAETVKATHLRAQLTGGLAMGFGALGILVLCLQRRRAEAALTRTMAQLHQVEHGAQRSAAFLESVGGATPNMLYAKDTEGRFTYVNPAALAALGHPLDAVIGQRSETLITAPEEARNHVAAEARVMATGRSEDVEGGFTDREGRARWLRSMKFPLRAAGGEIIGVAGLTMDVTEAYEIRQALARSEAKYRTIANAMPAIVWTAAADGQRDFYNDRWYEFTGAAAGSTDGWTWTRMIHLEDRRRVEDLIRRQFAQGQPYEIQYRLIGRQGARWVLERALPLRDATGEIRGWEGSCTDIQELQESRAEREAAIADLKSREAHLQSILDSVPDAMVVVDEAGTVQSFSAAGERLFDRPAAEVVGRDVNVLAPEPGRGDSRLRRQLLGREPRTAGIGAPLTGMRRDGSTFPMELSVAAASAAGGRYYTGFLRDLTERQDAELRLQNVQAELAHVSRLSAMGEMASALAHELNQPLTATASYLQGSLKLLEETPLREALLKGALTTANEQVLRAGAIIRRLREFVGKGETGRDTESLAQLLEEAGALAMVGAKDRGVRITFDVAPDADLVLVDKVQIQQVALNLMRNAIEAMATSPRRELTVSTRQSEPGTVTVSAADTGQGIDAGILERLFHPFVTSKSHGMGVGLSISRTIVEAHGGRIWAEARAGGGTIFHFTLPTVTEEDWLDAAVI